VEHISKDEFIDDMTKMVRELARNQSEKHERTSSSMLKYVKDVKKKVEKLGGIIESHFSLAEGPNSQQKIKIQSSIEKQQLYQSLSHNSSSSSSIILSNLSSMSSSSCCGGDEEKENQRKKGGSGGGDFLVGNVLLTTFDIKVGCLLSESLDEIVNSNLSFLSSSSLHRNGEKTKSTKTKNDNSQLIFSTLFNHITKVFYF